MQESDVERYLKESSKSYKECKAKNSARRNSLQKRTLGIETERKIAAASFNREEKLLREQLKQMNIEKMKISIIHNLRGMNLQYSFPIFLLSKYFKRKKSMGRCKLWKESWNWWSTISPMSVKRTMTAHLNSLNKKRPRLMTLEIQILTWHRDRDKHVAVLNG